jgi:hypothetical protein
MTEPTFEVMFQDMSYVPYNALLTILLTSQVAPTRKSLREEVVRMFGNFPSSALKKMTADQREIHDWLLKASTNLADQVAQSIDDGNSPARESMPAMKFFEAIARWLCLFPVPPLRGKEAYGRTFRWTQHKNGPIIDIVPADPRIGLADLLDWNAPG